MLAIYCRTSNSKIGRQDYSIETQQDGGVKLAKQLDVKFKFYIDEGISGTIRERESFMEMIEHIQGKEKTIEITGVYCIDQSRIERDSDIWRFFSAECINNNVKYYPNGNELDLNDITSKLFADLISLVNEYYSALTSKKVKLANAKKTLKGKTHGKIAFGYGSDVDNNFIINDDEAKIVKKIFNWKIEGLGNYIIANKLNEDNETKKLKSYWKGVTINGIIKNKIYKGIREWNKNDIENFIQHKLEVQIIENEIWDKANEVYKANRKNVGAKKQFNYLLDNVLYCGICGQKYFGKKRKEGSDSSYKCRGLNKHAAIQCRENRGVNIEKMDTFIIKHLFESKSLEKMLLNAPKNDGELNELKVKLEKLKTKKDLESKTNNRLYKLLSNPDLENDERFILDYGTSKNRLNKLSNEITELTQKTNEINDSNRNNKTKSLINKYTSDIDFTELKKIVNSLIEKIELVYDRKPTSHGGVFKFKIRYRNYEEFSVFISKSSLFEFVWLHYYRATAVTNDNLKEDIEDQKSELELIGINNEEDYIKALLQENLLINNELNPWHVDFNGKETLVPMQEIISFDNNELIHLN